MTETYKTLAKKYSTNKTGVYYKYISKTTISDNGKIKNNNEFDKIYSIRYKDNKNKDIWLTIGKYSEGIRENYSFEKRIQLLQQLKLGEVPEIIKKKTKQDILTLDLIAEQYFDYMKKKSTLGSIRDRKSKYNKHLIKLHSKDILSISKSDLTKIQNSLEKLKYSPKTINQVIELFATIYNFGLKQELYTNTNPALKVERFEVENTRDRYLTTDEIKLLLNKIKDNPILSLFINIALTTGVRLEGVLSIQKKDLDLDNAIVNLNDFKTKSTYKGFLTKDLNKQLKELTIGLKPNDYILNINGLKITDRQLQSRLKPILDDLFNEGLDTKDRKNRVVIHTLRHTFASHLAINGNPIFTIQKLMNHKDIKMTLRYAKLSPDSGKDMIEGLYQ